MMKLSSRPLRSLSSKQRGLRRLCQCLANAEAEIVNLPRLLLLSLSSLRQMSLLSRRFRVKRCTPMSPLQLMMRSLPKLFSSFTKLSLKRRNLLLKTPKKKKKKKKKKFRQKTQTKKRFMISMETTPTISMSPLKQKTLKTNSLSQTLSPS